MKKLLWQIPLLLSFFLFAGFVLGASPTYACSTGNDCPYYEYCDGGIPPFNNGTCRHFDLTNTQGGELCSGNGFWEQGGGFSAPPLGGWNGYTSWPWLSGAYPNGGMACPEGIIFGQHVGGVNYCQHTGSCTQSEYNGNNSGYSGSYMCEWPNTGSECGYNPYSSVNEGCPNNQHCTDYQACIGGNAGPCPGVMDTCQCICPAHVFCQDNTRTVNGFSTYNNNCNSIFCQPYCSTGGPVNCGAWDINEATNTCGTVGADRTCQHNTSPSGACVITDKSDYINHGFPQYNYCQTGAGYRCADITANGPVDCITHIFVHVYIDYGHDGGHDAPYPLANVCIGGNCQTTGADGMVTFDNLTTGTYNVTFTDSSVDYQQVGPTNQNVTLTNANGDQTVNFRVTPLYKISGTVFSDINKNLSYDGNPDIAYAGTSTIHVSGGPTTVGDMTQTNGVYDTGEVLQSGTYVVRQTHALDPGYFYTTPSTWTVTVGDRGTAGPQCNTSTSPDAACGNPNDGSIANLNFGVTNENSWEQSTCFDVRDDSGTYHNEIPAAPSCGGVTGAYNSVVNGDCSTGAGIIFSCNATPDFGLGSANANNWQAGGAAVNQQECFSGAGLDVVRTSYSYLSTTAQESGIVPTDMASVCGGGGIANCTLDGSLTKGIYIAHGDVHLNAFIFPVDATTPQSFIFLVNGDLHIEGNIIVPAGSVAAFSTSGSIYIDKSVGNVVTNPDDSNVNNPNIEGLYSADGSFIVETYGTGNNVCNANGTPLDRKLNIIGSVVTNAAKNGGSFVNNRDLCIYDLQCSPVSFGEGNPNSGGTSDENLATSYILTLFADGKFLSHKLFNWEELKP